MADERRDDRLTGALDAVLHLMDRQVVDVRGQMVCKVDDLELTVVADNDLYVTALLSGPAALVARFGDRRFGRLLRDFWRRLNLERTDREDPYRIDLRLVARLGSAVELSVPRDGVLTPQAERSHRLDRLLQMKVYDEAGRQLGRPLDVRLDADARHPDRRLRVVGLVVGRGRPGTYFGYDRRPDMGPWLVNRVVLRLHRHSVYVALEDVEELDWQTGVLRVRSGTLGAVEAAS